MEGSRDWVWLPLPYEAHINTIKKTTLRLYRLFISPFIYSTKLNRKWRNWGGRMAEDALDWCQWQALQVMAVSSRIYCSFIRLMFISGLLDVKYLCTRFSCLFAESRSIQASQWHLSRDLEQDELKGLSNVQSNYSQQSDDPSAMSSHSRLWLIAFPIQIEAQFMSLLPDLRYNGSQSERKFDKNIFY